MLPLWTLGASRVLNPWFRIKQSDASHNSIIKQLTAKILLPDDRHQRQCDLTSRAGSLRSHDLHLFLCECRAQAPAGIQTCSQRSAASEHELPVGVRFLSRLLSSRSHKSTLTAGQWHENRPKAPSIELFVLSCRVDSQCSGLVSVWRNTFVEAQWDRTSRKGTVPFLNFQRNT